MRTGWSLLPLTALLVALVAPPALAAGELTLTLVGGDRDKEGLLVLGTPFERELGLTLRLTNTGDVPVQVSRSSHPWYRFFALDVVRIGIDGEEHPVPAHFDLYPLKDMKMPNREWVTLAPGESIERDLSVLLREAYGLGTLAAAGSGRHLPELRGRGFGEMRRPGRFRVTGVYRAVPEPDLFEQSVGRDEAVPAFAGPDVRTKPLTVFTVVRWSWSPKVRAEVKADRIVRGSLIYFHTNYIVAPAEVLRGPPAEDLIVFAREGEGPWLATNAKGERVFLFVTMRSGVFLVGDLVYAVREPKDLDALRQRLRYFAELAAEAPPADPGMETRVRELLSRICRDPESQAKTLADLEGLGEAAVPAIVRHMDDRRPLPRQAVSFRNRFEGAFEAVRHYSPELVVDALAALLNQLTGERFGLDYNDATDTQRRHAVSAWRVYAWLGGR